MAARTLAGAVRALGGVSARRFGRYELKTLKENGLLCILNNRSRWQGLDEIAEHMATLGDVPHGTTGAELLDLMLAGALTAEAYETEAERLCARYMAGN